MARISQCFDLLNKVVIDSEIGHYNNSNEKDMALKHMEVTNENDLLLGDRGYPSFFIFKNMQRNSKQFCFRIPVKKWNVMKEFVDSGMEENFIEMAASKEAKRKCKNYGLDSNPVTLRLIRIELDDGEIEVLATSLFDREKFPHSVFKDLYFMRWGIEEEYKHLKLRMEVENFSGKSTLVVRQDFYAKVFMVNFTEMLSKPAIDKIDQGNKDCETKYQINRTQALAKMKQFFMPLVLFKDVEQLLKIMLNMFVKDKEIIRKGRSFERTNLSKRRKKFPISYKPIL